MDPVCLYSYRYVRTSIDFAFCHLLTGSAQRRHPKLATELSIAGTSDDGAPLGSIDVAHLRAPNTHNTHLHSTSDTMARKSSRSKSPSGKPKVRGHASSCTG